MVWATHDINMLKNVITKLIKILPFVIVIVAFPFFFFGGVSEGSSNLFSALWDCGHLVFFIALVMVLSKKFDVNNWRVGILITAGVFVAGGLIEIIQANIGRDGNWGDLLRDLTGTWLGIFWLQRSRKWIWVGRVFSVVLLVPNLTAVFFEAWYQLDAMQKFPLLAGFESPIETHWGKKEDERSAQYYTQGSHSLRLMLTKKPYSGIKFGRLMKDWRGFNYLSFDIYNPDSQPLDMSVRVNDMQHKQHNWRMTDRFNKSFHLASGWNHLSFPLDDIQHAPENRLMDLSQISWVEIFVGNLPEARIIYVDNLRLE
jgi:VanZ family protein